MKDKKARAKDENAGLNLGQMYKVTGGCVGVKEYMYCIFKGRHDSSVYRSWNLWTIFSNFNVV
jgi:hypothetical protein